MSTIKSSDEHLTLNADGSAKSIKFQANGVEKGSLSSTGVMTATSFAGSGANLTGINSVPTGVIAMWSGAAGAIPSGWVICDGNNSTPNLTDKFIKSTGTAGGTGGSATTGATTLTIAQMPAHTHNRQPYAPGATAAYVASSYNSFFDANSGVTSSTGGGGSHTHPQSEPVYFALIFIMKT